MPCTSCRAAPPDAACHETGPAARLPRYGHEVHFQSVCAYALRWRTRSPSVGRGSTPGVSSARQDPRECRGVQLGELRHGLAVLRARGLVGHKFHEFRPELVPFAGRLFRRSGRRNRDSRSLLPFLAVALRSSPSVRPGLSSPPGVRSMMGLGTSRGCLSSERASSCSPGRTCRGRPGSRLPSPRDVEGPERRRGRTRSSSRPGPRGWRWETASVASSTCWT